MAKTESEVSLVVKEIQDLEEIQRLKKLYRLHAKPHDIALTVAGDAVDILEKCQSLERYQYFSRMIDENIEKARQHYDEVIRKLPLKFCLGDFLLGDLVSASAEEPGDRRALGRDLAKLLDSFMAALK